MSHSEPSQNPEGLQPPAPGTGPRPDEGRQPHWLVGTDEGFDAEPQAQPRQTAPALRRPGDPTQPPVRIPIAGESVPTQPRPTVPSSPGTARPAAPDLQGHGLETPGDEAAAPRSWAAAASSVPRLTVVPKRETAEHCTAVEDGDLATPLPGGGQDDAGSGRDEDGPLSAEPALEPPVEPWWLVAVETLATHRPLQIGIVSVIAIVAAVMFWPRRENQSTPLAEIRRHPVRFEGQSVRVRGEVGEVFEIGQSFVYHLRQGRDTVVVFSPSGRPATHDKIVLLGTVSAGYLDGVPRVAVFETPGTRVTRR